MALIEVAEEAATSTALRAWLVRWAPTVFNTGISIVESLFGTRNKEPTTNNAIGPIANFLLAPAVVMHDIFGRQVHYFQAIYNAIHRSFGYTYNRTNYVLHQAQHMYNVNRAFTVASSRNVLHQAQHLYNMANANTARKVAGEATKRQAADVAERHFAEHVYNAANANTALKVAQERTLRVSADSALLHSIQHEHNVAREYADTVSTQAAARSSAKLSSDSATAVHPAYSGAVADLADAATAAGAGLPALRALISRVPTAAPDTLPAAEAAQGAITRVLTRSLADCVVPNCRNLSKYGRDLSGLGDLLGGAGLLAFLAWAIAHPAEAAADTRNVAGGIVDGTVHEVETLLGV